MTTFYVNQRVVCVDDSERRELREGGVYTVAVVKRRPSQVGRQFGPYPDGKVCLVLNEARNPTTPWGAYACERFRPLVNEHFHLLTECLNTVPKEMVS